MGIKYYYSAPQQVRLGRFLANSNGDPIFVYPGSKLVKNLPRITVCTILEDNKLYVGFSTCSTKDQYSKKRGQLIAKNRAQNKPYKVVEIPNIKDIHEISDKIIEEIYDLETQRIFYS